MIDKPDFSLKTVRDHFDALCAYYDARECGKQAFHLENNRMNATIKAYDRDITKEERDLIGLYIHERYILQQNVYFSTGDNKTDYYATAWAKNTY